MSVDLTPSESTGQLAGHELTVDFGSLRALDKVSIRFNTGEIHALLGPNGSGKSTLVKLFGGVVPAQHGSRVELPDGRIVRQLNPGLAARAGLRFVHQDLALVPELSVADNMFLANAYPTTAGRISWRRTFDAVDAVLRQLELSINPKSTVDSLRHGQRVLVALARALLDLPATGGLLFVDEPTASLDEAESQELLSQLRTLVSARNVGVCLITHRLHEVVDFAHRVTVLRDGRVSLQGDAGQVDQATLLRALGGTTEERRRPNVEGVRETGQPLLELDELSLGDECRAISLSVGRGEIVGITGPEGSGKEAVVAMLSGSRRATSGKAWLSGSSFRPLSERYAVQHGLGVVPADRSSRGAFAELPISYNILAPHLGRDARGPWLVSRRARQRAATLTSRFGVVPPDPHRQMSSLSGGNQQKVIFGRWLAADMKVLVLHEPTSGVDVASRQTLYELTRRAVDEEGLGVLVVSSDLVEVAELCDRAIVMVDGRATAELVQQDLTVERLLGESFPRREDEGSVDVNNH